MLKLRPATWKSTAAWGTQPLAAAVAAFIWAVGDGQFDDPEGPAVRILDDDEE